MLVVADLQLGREEELRSHGHLVLDRELSSMKRRLGRALKKTKAARLLINGDIKHEFARINQQEWNSVLDLLDFFKKQEIEVILVKGNHDNMLAPIAQSRGYELHDFFIEKRFLFCHGDKIPEFSKAEWVEINTIIIGHEHPALRFNDGVRKETAKCFLAGEWKSPVGRIDLVVLPSFSEVTQGSDVLEGESLGPFMEEKNNFAAFLLVENRILSFGTLKEIRAAMNIIDE